MPMIMLHVFIAKLRRSVADTVNDVLHRFAESDLTFGIL